MDKNLFAIIRGVRCDEVLTVAEVLISSGIKSIEVPLNSPGAFDSISLLVKNFSSKAFIGAGTVTTIDEVKKLYQIGCQFIVSPNFDFQIVCETKKLGMLSYPGVLTPSEAFSAIKAGADALKLFPARLLGTKGLKDLKSILPKSAKLLAVGGVEAKDFGIWAKAGADGYGLGSSLYRPGISLDELRQRAELAVSSYNQKHLSISIFDENRCELGEGPIWHKDAEVVFWFDILKCRLYAKNWLNYEIRTWQFKEMVSAGAVFDYQHLVIASESELFKFNIYSGSRQHLFDLENNNSKNRSNDARADIFGGLWVGTMGKKAEKSAGSIYRFYKGKVRQLFKGLTITNSISFSPDGKWVYFSDTYQQKLFRVQLDNEGWPSSDSNLFIDFRSQKLNPDGSVVDKAGNLWIAMWGSFGVYKYSPEGKFLKKIWFPTPNVSCPLFGGESLNRLYVTSARQGLTTPFSLELAGATFSVELEDEGLASNKAYNLCD